MTPRKPPSPEDVVEAIRVLSGTLEHTNSYLEMIAETVDRLRSEISWLIENREEIFPRVIRAMPLDPCDAQWSEKLARLNENAPEAPQNSTMTEEKPAPARKTTLFD